MRGELIESGFGELTIHPPCAITARLLPGIKVGDAFLSIEYAGHTDDNRQRYRYYIDTRAFEHTAEDLKSGVGGGSLQDGLENLLSFLGAAAETFDESDENADLFPARVVEWARENSNEITCAQLDLEENKNLIVENSK